MNMTSSTSMTSTSGVTLISERGAPPPPPPPPIAMVSAPLLQEVAANDVEEVLLEGLHLAGEHADLPHEVVVRHDRRDRRHEADRGRDQRLRHARRDEHQA